MMPGRAAGPSALAWLLGTVGSNSVSFLLSPQSCAVCSGTNSVYGKPSFE